MEAIIQKCSCEHEYQDKKYGKGRRVHNPTNKKQGEISVVRCTVCSREVPIAKRD